MYLVNTRANICYAVHTLSQFMVEPKRAHWVAAKHVLRYLQGIVDIGLLYTEGKDIILSGFTKADSTGSLVDWKSTFGYCFKVGSGMTSWCCRKQKSVALSSSEAEYMATSLASREAIWLRKLLVNLFRRNMEVTRIIDSVQRGAVQFSYTPTGEQGADILTKALGRTKFDHFREKMGMVKNSFQKQKWE
eukprot:PITA_01815